MMSFKNKSQRISKFLVFVKINKAQTITKINEQKKQHQKTQTIKKQTIKRNGH